MPKVDAQRRRSAPAEHPPSAERLAGRLAKGQHGVLARRQLLAAGPSKDVVARLVRAGVLLRVHAGVYAVGHDALSQEGRWLAAVLACGPNAVLSHRSAAALWAMRPSGLCEVTVPGTRAPSHPGIVVHRTRRLPAGDVRRHKGIAVTSPGRTLLDLAATMPARDVERAEGEALYLGLNVQGLTAVNGRRGLPKLHRATAPTSRTRTPEEEALVGALREHDAPAFVCNEPLKGPSGTTWYPDVLFAAQRLVVEVDDPSHELPGRPERDARRDADLLLLGFRTLRLRSETVRGDPRAAARAVLGQITPHRGASAPPRGTAAS